MALSCFVPLPSSSSNRPYPATSCRRPLPAHHRRSRRCPCSRATPRLQFNAAKSVASSSPTSPAAEALDPFFLPKPASSPHSRSPIHPLLESLEDNFRSSPNGELAKRWREYHGCGSWAGLLDPLDADLRAEIIKYGDLAQLTYDAFDHEKRDCHHEEQELLQSAGLTWTGYTVTKYIYASPEVHMLPKWLENRTGMHGQHESSWIGFIAVGTDEKEIARLGRRDIVVVWRGTVTRLEWLEDMDGAIIEPIGISNVSHMPALHGHLGVERGFHTLYTACNVDAPHGHVNASKQVRDEVTRLMDLYKGEKSQMSITMTGHSLGGALALLAAYDVSSNCIDDDIPVSVMSFAAPRVGNEAFMLKLEELGVKVLRIVNIHDMVPKVPGILAHDASPAHDVNSHTHNLAWNTYVHVGVELRLDNHFSPFLKKVVKVVDAHNLELYLHLLDGYRGANMPFLGLYNRDHHHARSTFGKKEVLLNAHQLDQLHFCMRFMKRDVTLINKTTSLLLDELHVEAKWQERKLPKPSPRLSLPTIPMHPTTNVLNHLVHDPSRVVYS